MHEVNVAFGITPRAQRELIFAAKLASRLGSPLHVWRPRQLIPETLDAGERFGQVPVQRVEATHVADRVRRLIDNVQLGARPVFVVGTVEAESGPGQIIVGRRDLRVHDGAAHLAPMDEIALEARGWGPVCIPFGNAPESTNACRRLLDLAWRLMLPVRFYHTTWKMEGVADALPPSVHMMPAAIAVKAALEETARRRRMTYRTVIETAASIDEGVCRFALREGCSLIALSRGEHVGRGSYVDDILARSTTPVYVEPRRS